MNKNFVVIASFPQAVEAHIARSKLKSEGIEAFIRDENIVTINWLWSNAVGGVKLAVGEADAERAKQILNNVPPDFSLPDSIAEKCPKCGSTEVAEIHHRTASTILEALSFLLFLLPAPSRRKNRRCEKCGRRWRG